MKRSLKIAVVMSAIALGTAAPAVAQAATGPATTYPATQENEDEFPWGLLGLLGLAGLLGLKRRDDDHTRTGTGSTNR
jgi:MYXO-CTERM domain-containing protein